MFCALYHFKMKIFETGSPVVQVGPKIPIQVGMALSLGLQACATTLDLCSVGNRTQGFIHASKHTINLSESPVSKMKIFPRRVKYLTSFILTVWALILLRTEMKSWLHQLSAKSTMRLLTLFFSPPGPLLLHQEKRKHHSKPPGLLRE